MKFIAPIKYYGCIPFEISACYLGYFTRLTRRAATLSVLNAAAGNERRSCRKGLRSALGAIRLGDGRVVGMESPCPARYHGGGPGIRRS
jgi:hypothetical protein